MMTCSSRRTMAAPWMAAVGIACWMLWASPFADAFVGVVPLAHKQQHSSLADSQHQHRCVVTTPSSTVLYMGWGPEPIWTTTSIVASEEANPSGQSQWITVNMPGDFEYTIPGQYVQVKVGDEKPLFLALASPPPKEGDDETATTIDFLVKKTPDNTWLTGAAPGAPVEISQVLGNGFPMQENLEGFKYDFPTQNVLLFAAGSGIAPIKAAMESDQLQIAKAGQGGRTARLYYGVRTADDLCFVDDFAKWESLGFQVVPVLSQPNGDWQGRSGYVQNALEEDGVPIPRNTGALLCGMKGMAEAVKDILLQAGVFEGRVLTNF